MVWKYIWLIYILYLIEHFLTIFCHLSTNNLLVWNIAFSPTNSCIYFDAFLDYSVPLNYLPISVLVSHHINY